MKKFFKWLLSFMRLIRLKLIYGNRLEMDYEKNKKPVYIGAGVQINVAPEGHIKLGGVLMYQTTHISV